VRVVDARTLWIPDSPGNNRLDSLHNIAERGNVRLLFMIPGFDETLRINGRATLTTDADTLARCGDARRTPKLVIRVEVREVYLHCAKAFMRSKLWAPEGRVPRDTLPTMGQMLNDQTGIVTPAETTEEMQRRYAPDL
jgi:hypothetical protein